MLEFYQPDLSLPLQKCIYMHISHILAPCLVYLRISSCGGTLWQDNRHIIGRNKYSLAWKKNPEY